MKNSSYSEIKSYLCRISYNCTSVSYPIHNQMFLGSLKMQKDAEVWLETAPTADCEFNIATMLRNILRHTFPKFFYSFQQIRLSNKSTVFILWPLWPITISLNLNITHI